MPVHVKFFISSSVLSCIKYITNPPSIVVSPSAFDTVKPAGIIAVLFPSLYSVGSVTLVPGRFFDFSNSSCC